MKIVFIVRILDFFEKFLHIFGEDYYYIRLILNFKFLQSSRRNLIGFGKLMKKKSDSILGSLIFNLVVGTAFLPIIKALSEKSPLLSLSFFYFVSSVFIFISLISEFSVTLLDTKDSELLLPTPINKKALNIAKNLHIFLFYNQLSFAFSIPLLIFWWLKFGAVSSISIFFFNMLFLKFLIIINSIIYGLIFKKFDNEKLRDFINSFQIISIIVIFLGAQLIIHTSEFFFPLIENDSFFLHFIPLIWLAAPSIMLAGNSFNLLYTIYFLMFLLLTFIISFYYKRRIAPDFEQNILKVKNEITHSPKRRNFWEFLFVKASFFPFLKLSNLIISSDRKLKLSIYPQLTMAFFYGAVVIFIPDSNHQMFFNRIYLLYFFISFSNQIFLILNHSEFYKAAWIFHFLPIKSPENILKGAHISVYLKFIFPLFFSISALSIYSFSPKIITDLLIIFLNSIILILIFLIMNERVLPFSREFLGARGVQMKGSSYLLNGVVLTPLSAGLHFAFSVFSFGKFIFLIVQIISIALLFSNYYKLKWIDIKK